jgi:predicted SAM-dependent methyltransferase
MIRERVGFVGMRWEDLVVAGAYDLHFWPHEYLAEGLEMLDECIALLRPSDFL